MRLRCRPSTTVPASVSATRGCALELEQLERDGARLDTMTDAEVREVGLPYADRAGYDEAWCPTDGVAAGRTF
jgi:hypothetical protein